MSSTFIHPTAIVSPKAQLGVNVKIGPFTIINDDVIIGDNNEIRSSVYIDNGARIGSDNRIHSNVVIATEPQDLKYNNEQTFVEIGDRNVIREFATINRGTTSTYRAIVGSDNLIMTYCHIAHDCVLGNNIILSNVVQLAGHVHIDDFAILGGTAKVHQFCSIGKYAMVGGDVKVTKDIPPYTLVGENPPRIDGINRIGLKRRGFTSEQINIIYDFYQTVVFSGYNTTDGLIKIKEKGNIPDYIQIAIDFIEKSNRGIYRGN
jgi:UDP-N-acetylglucosamine acyltransferase